MEWCESTNDCGGRGGAAERAEVAEIAEAESAETAETISRGVRRGAEKLGDRCDSEVAAVWFTRPHESRGRVNPGDEVTTKTKPRLMRAALFSW